MNDRLQVTRPPGPAQPPGGAGDAPAPVHELVLLEEIGRGRSGVVHRARDAEGRALACKVFDAQGLTKLVQWIFLGAPNPYVWSEDAVRCAALRREILGELVPFWLDGRLRVAAAHGTRWNAEERAHQLDTAFVAGRPPRLHHPRRVAGSEEPRELRREVLAPLQERLIEAGFDGLVWQAGLGNPVALNNFLRVDEEGGARWVWIDLESGVPALFPLDPRALVRFYLPRALRYDHALFDDVDGARLVAYLDSEPVQHGLGTACHARLVAAANELVRRQASWRALRRHERMIGYRLARGELDGTRAEWYRARPLRWYARELRRALAKAPRRLGRLIGSGWRRVAVVPYARLMRESVSFLFSQRFRYALSRRYVARRLRAWERRGQMDRTDADSLRGHLTREESSSYLCDFGVHVAIKPFVKAIEYWIVPGLFAAGLVGQGTVALTLLVGGAVARTLYTSGRLVQAWVHGRERPWAALFVGVLPVFGNLAYPLQIVWSSTEKEDDLARFLLYDGFARVGAHLPIWGGEDTLTEHVLNRWPDRLVRLRRRPAG